MSDDLDLHVSGGVGGTYARYEDIEQLAWHSEQLGTELAGIAAECHALLAHPDVVASAVLNPEGVAGFEARLLAALDGPNGLSALAIGLGADAVALHTAAATYHSVDEAQARLIDSVRWAAGDVVGMAPVVPLLGGMGLAGLVLADPWLHEHWQELLTDHPGVVDNLVGMGPGLLTGLPGPGVISDVPSGARMLGMLYPDGPVVVTDRGTDFDARATKPPSTFHDLLNGLNNRDLAAKETPGEIDVRMVTHPDGSHAYIVDIPGTKTWQLPGQETTSVNDVGTNLHAMGGEQTSYEKGISDALHQAGADDGAPIMLVGHSQGGIVAAQMAQHLADSDYNITHVVTAGSPIGRIDIPDQVQVLSLENEHDIVPHLDAADNPDRPNQVTVTFDSQHGTIKDNHGIEQTYAPGAQALDDSTDPSVLAYKESASAFFAPNDHGNDDSQAEPAATAHIYQVTRG